ncbi:hypothetical protein Sliba_00670 [Streptomyces nigrescens]|uniref:Transposase DDE domain-containing protein n=1 Tax=Streptomyces nigrescens TaxID=1920 RepID=A0A640T8V1_STRNI|nr:hypothetical protein Sliba_00670 [Streptomyces libani subsp. libani]GGW04520.1 hypothetical protein GCM10010500_66750 [Streptomyces libani subsp. libani]
MQGPGGGPQTAGTGDCAGEQPVDRTLGWIMKARRNVRDHERLPQHSEAHLTWALITLMTLTTLMTRRLTRRGPR